MAIDLTFKHYVDNVYYLQTPGSKIYMVVGEKMALVFDLGKRDLDLVAEIRKITPLPYVVIVSHSALDHIACLNRGEEVYVHPDELHRMPEGKKYLLVHDGDIFDLGGTKIRVLHTPGHTPGCLCLIDDEKGRLFTADTVCLANVHMYGEECSMPLYLESLIRLKEISARSNVREMFPAHREFPIGTEVIDRYIELAGALLTGKAQPTEVPESITSHMKQEETDKIVYYANQEAGIVLMKKD